MKLKIQESKDFINTLKEFNLTDKLFQIVNDDEDNIGIPSEETRSSIRYPKKSFRYVHINPERHGFLKGTIDASPIWETV